MRSIPHTLLTITACVLLRASPVQAQATPPYDPTDRYESRQIQGWGVLINKRLLEKPELAQAATLELEHQIYQVARRLPPVALAKLKSVKIWLELDDAGVPGGVYHPSVAWLRTHHFNPAKAKCVEFGNAQNLLKWNLQQPFMLLHELAHAYHDQVLGYNYPPIAAAYREALDSKRYEKVLHVDGQTMRHYALNNDQEFFAEMSEAFFGTNNIYPFVRGELKTFDPATFHMVTQAWGLMPDGTLPSATATATTRATGAAQGTTGAPPAKDSQDGPGLYRVSAGPGGKYSTTLRAKSREDAIDQGLATVAQKAMDFDENVNINQLKVEKIGP